MKMENGEIGGLSSRLISEKSEQEDCKRTELAQPLPEIPTLGRAHI